MPQHYDTPAADLKDFEIEVCRTGFGFATISVKAASEYEAGQLALDAAGDHSYSEKDSQYQLVHEIANPVEEAHLNKKMSMYLGVSDDEGHSDIHAVRIDWTRREFEKLKTLGALLATHNLSEVRRYESTDAVFGHSGEPTDSLDSPELQVGRNWFAFLDASGLRSLGVTFAQVEAAFDEGRTLFVMPCEGASTTDAVDFLEMVGINPIDINFDLESIIYGPHGVVGREEIQDELEGRTLPAER